MSKLNAKLAEAADYTGLNDCYITTLTESDGRYQTIIAGGNLAVLGGIVQIIKYYADRTGKTPEEVMQAVNETFRIQKPLLDQQRKAPRVHTAKTADHKKKKGAKK